MLVLFSKNRRVTDSVLTGTRKIVLYMKDIRLRPL